MADNVLYALDARIARLAINRPDTLNSIDIATVAALIAGVERALRDEAAVLVLTGTGRAFCSGADLGAALDADLKPEDIDLGAPMRSHYGLLVQMLDRKSVV